MLHILRARVAQQEIVLTEISETLTVYGINEGRHTQQGRHFFSVEVGGSPRVLQGDANLHIYPLDRGRWLVMLEVAGFNTHYTLSVEPEPAPDHLR